MKKLQTLLLLIVGLVATAQAQLNQSGGTIIIEQGAVLIVTGDINNTGGSLRNGGEITLGGDFVNEGTLSSNSSGVLTFDGNTNANFTTNGATIEILELHKTGANLILDGTLELEEDLNFEMAAGARLILNDDDLTLTDEATITGAGANEYVETAGTGSLRRELGADGSVDFPVGNATGQTLLTADVSATGFSQASLSARVDAMPAPDLPDGTTDFVNRHWTISATGITDYSNTISATYLPGEVTGQEGPIAGAAFENGMWNNENAMRSGQTLTATGSSENIVFSGFGFVPLPVELVAFSAEAIANGDVELQWTTASEEAALAYDIQRSSTITDWETIGRVAAAGESIQALTYSYTDANLPEGFLQDGGAYYRLRMEDLDGSVEFSPVRHVTLSSSLASLSIYPNPAQGPIRVDAPGKVLSLQVLDIHGREVLLGASSDIDLNTLRTGTYQLVVQTDAGLFSGRVVKR